MKVYSVLLHTDYEGCDLLGVFASRDEAVAFARGQKDFGKYALQAYGVVESELGQAVDFYSMVDWVE